MPFRFGRNFKSRSRLFADLVRTFYSGGTESKTVEQAVEVVENQDLTIIDTANTDAMSAATYYVNANHNSESHFTTISVVLSNNKTEADFTEYSDIKTNGALAHYDFEVDEVDGNLNLRATPTEDGVTFKVTRILVE